MSVHNKHVKQQICQLVHIYDFQANTFQHANRIRSSKQCQNSTVFAIGYGVSHTAGVKVVQVHRHTLARKCHRYLVPGNVDSCLKHDMKFG